MENDWNIATQFMSIFNNTSCHVSKEIDVCIVSCTSGNLKDNRALCLDACLNDCLHLFHIIEVECTDGISTLNCLGEHFSCVHQSKFFIACHKSLLNVKPVLI